MTKKDRYLVALDVGSTKTCALIADLEDGQPKFLAMGAAESKGSRKGLIVNLDAAVSSIRRALEEAEGVAGVPVESAVVGVAGSHVRGVNSRGGIVSAARPRDIEREDVRRAVDAARAITLPGRSRSPARAAAGISASISQDSIRDPIGMVGQKLEVNVHIVTASAAATQNIVTAVNRAGVVVTDTALETAGRGRSRSHAGRARTRLLPARHRRRHHGIARLRRRRRAPRAALPVGGDHFTNDLAVGLRTPIPEAEKIKRHHGCAWHELARAKTRPSKSPASAIARRAPFSRACSTKSSSRARRNCSSLVRDELKRAGLDAQIPAGLVLAGGGARLTGLVELAETLVLACPCASPRRAASRACRKSFPSPNTQPQ